MTIAYAEMVARRVYAVAIERLVDDPVVLLEGPRSVGKSTLLRQIALACDARVVDLDDPAMRDAVSSDPGTFVGGAEPVCVDEYQREPIVLDAIKSELNRDGRPGRFVLTGSTRHDALPVAAQSLTGRLARLKILPFSQGEIAGVRENLVERMFADPAGTVAARPSSETTREEYIDRMVTGGFPMVLTREAGAARVRWLDEYIALTLERDVRDLSKIRHGALLPELLRRLAGQTGQVLNVEKTARDVGLDAVTAESYIRLLCAVFLVHRLPAWGKTLSSRSAGSPKVHVLDSGVAARLLRLTPEKLGRRDPSVLTELGHLLESFAVGEILKQVSWLENPTVAGHWRTHDHDEVDLVLERDDGAILAFEIKAAGRVPDADFHALRKLRSAVGEAFVGGVALYLGTRSYTFDDRLYAMPMDRLWVDGATTSHASVEQ